jgi:hypothetical protein
MTPQPAEKKESWRKTHYACSVCDQKAIGCYRPDMDIKGLCFCAKHKEQVFLAYAALMSGVDDDVVNDMLELEDE